MSPEIFFFEPPKISGGQAEGRSKGTARLLFHSNHVVLCFESHLIYEAKLLCVFRRLYACISPTTLLAHKCYFWRSSFHSNKQLPLFLGLAKLPPATQREMRSSLYWDKISSRILLVAECQSWRRPLAICTPHPICSSQTIKDLVTLSNNLNSSSSVCVYTDKNGTNNSPEEQIHQW